MKIKHKKTVIIGLSCVLAAAAVVGVVWAYLTDSQKTDNIFRAGNVEVILTEPDYPETIESRVMVPHSKIPKNPKVTNVGQNDAFVFLKVTVPEIEAEPVKSDNRLKNPFSFEGAERIPGNEWMEIFSLLSDDPMTARTETIPDGITEQAEKNLYLSDWYMLENLQYNRKWILMDKTDNGNHTNSYLFAYQSVLVSSDHVTPGYGIVETEPLFDFIQLKSFVEDEDYYGSVQQIRVEAFAIQADELMGVTEFGAVPLNKENPEKWQLKRAYDIYFNQASGVMAE